MQGFTGYSGTLTPLYDKDGKQRYNRAWLWYHVPLFDYKAHRTKPFYYTDADGTCYMPDNHFETDGGSIPPACRAIPFAQLDPLIFVRSYVSHDCPYQYGGMYIRFKGETEFMFRLMTRRETDALMCGWLQHDGANLLTRRVVLNGIAIGSWTLWPDGPDTAKAKKQKANRAKAHINVYDRAGNLIEDNGGKRIFKSSIA
jgi:hypothetical protein